MTDNKKSNDLSDWDDCPPGELSKMVNGISASQARARNKKLIQTGVVSMVLVACGVVVVGSFSSPSGMLIGGITCPECVSHFAEYHSHVTGATQLENATLATSMATHLANCRMCQSRFNESYPGILKSTALVPTRHRIASHLPLLAVSQQPAYY